MAESQKLIHIICSSISITDIGVGARDEPPMSLEPGMITDGRVPGARSVPGGRNPCVLTSAPLGRDIAPGVAGRSVGATLLAPVDGYRLNSDHDRDSECGPFTLVYGCLKPAPNRHFPPLSATCSTIVWGGIVLCKLNRHKGMGTVRTVLRRWRRRVAGTTTNRHDKSKALFTMFFRRRYGCEEAAGERESDMKKRIECQRNKPACRHVGGRTRNNPRGKSRFF